VVNVNASSSSSDGGGVASLLSRSISSSNVIHDCPVELTGLMHEDIPFQIQDIADLAAGKDSTGVVMNDGKCYTWGANKFGQLGHEPKVVGAEVSFPTLLETDEIMEGGGVKKLVLGNSFSAIIDKAGDLYTFGNGGSTMSGIGFLGHGDGNDYIIPKKVESLVEDGCFAKDVCVGKYHTTVLTEEGEVLTAGPGSWGTLGNFDPEEQLYFEPVELLAEENIEQICSGSEFSLALTSEGMILGWGRNDKGQLAGGGGTVVDMYALENMPCPIDDEFLSGKVVRKIATGPSHCACLTEDGEVAFWGLKQYFVPTEILIPTQAKCIDIWCGGDYVCVLSEEGDLFTFGKGKYGVLGNFSKSTSWVPSHLEALKDKSVVNVCTGINHVLCLVEDNNS